MNPPKILCVDDSRMVHSLLERVLGAYEVQMLFAFNGGQGLELAAREHPDLILLDFKMPVLNGLEFLEKMREELALKETRILMITSERTREVVENIVRLGICDYIMKPFAEAILINRVARHVPLQLKKTGPSLPKPSGLASRAESSAVVNPAKAAPPARAVRSLTARDIRLVVKRIVKDPDGQDVECGESVTIADKINEYLLLFGTANSYLISIFLKLLEAGKVRVDLRDHCERLQLENPAPAFTRAGAVAIVDEHLDMLRRSDRSEKEFSVTQRISLHQLRSMPPRK